MKKKIVSFFCFSLIFCLAIPTLAEEKDYSFLEDMSIKEIKKLDSAIHYLLDDNEEGEEFIEEFSYIEDLSVKEIKELDLALHELLGDSKDKSGDGKDGTDGEVTLDISDDDKELLEYTVDDIKSYLKDPDSFYISTCYFYTDSTKLVRNYKDWAGEEYDKSVADDGSYKRYVYIEYMATNSYGGYVSGRAYGMLNDDGTCKAIGTGEFGEYDLPRYDAFTKLAFLYAEADFDNSIFKYISYDAEELNKFMGYSRK